MHTSELLEKIKKHLNLEWTYEQQIEENEIIEQQQASLEIIPPSLEELNQLYELALKGRIKNIQQRVKELAKADSNLVNFANKINKYAKSFQIEQIQAFLQKYME
ncbi:MAG: hypothetical protein MJK14_20460 [Rivularia sp. ALOHA_DT_140]|nr:hypothetical protein [Rivularia sp. ALOHA_DT_140]